MTYARHELSLVLYDSIVSFLCAGSRSAKKAMRVLVVEDSMRMAQLMREGLLEEDYLVDVATDGLDGLRMAAGGDYDLVLLDINLPGIDGFEFMKRLCTARSDVPVMMVTARDDVQNRVDGLDSGADDYLVKPFSFEELLARMRALLRRPASHAQTLLSYGDIELDCVAGRASRAGKSLSLSSREFALLRVLLEHPNQIIARERLFESVWRVKFDGASNVLEVYINYLRNKLEEHGRPRAIHTVRGRGYLLGDESSA